MKVGLGWALNWCGSDFILVSLWLYLPAEARADTQGYHSLQTALLTLPYQSTKLPLQWKFQDEENNHIKQPPKNTNSKPNT